MTMTTPARSRILCFAGALVVLGACAAGVTREGDFFRSKKWAYRIAVPGDGWRRVEIEETELAFFNERHGVTMILSRSCKPRLRTAPPALGRELAIGLKDREMVFDGRVDLPAGEAHRFDVRGTAGGAPIAFSAFVLTRGRCVFDLLCLGRPENLAAVAAEFEAFARSFRFDGTAGAG